MGITATTICRHPQKNTIHSGHTTKVETVTGIALGAIVAEAIVLDRGPLLVQGHGPLHVAAPIEGHPLTNTAKNWRIVAEAWKDPAELCSSAMYQLLPSEISCDPFLRNSVPCGRFLTIIRRREGLFL